MEKPTLTDADYDAWLESLMGEHHGVPVQKLLRQAFAAGGALVEKRLGPRIAILERRILSIIDQQAELESKIKRVR